MPAAAAVIDEFRDRRPIPGSRVVAAAFVLAVFAWGLGFYGLSVYTQFLGAAGRWSLATLSLATTLYFICGSISIGLADRLARRHGRRRVAAAGIVALAGGVVCLPHVPWSPLLLLTYAVMAFGWASTSGTAITQIIGTWFDARRGLALSLALTGASVAGFTVVPAMVWAIGRTGVAAGLAWTALVCAVAAALAVGALVERPDDGGPDARPRPATADTAPQPVATDAASSLSPGWPADAASQRWALTLLFVIGWFAQVAFLSQQVPLLAPRIGAPAAAAAVATTTVAAIVGRLLLGLAADRVDPRVITAGCLLSQVAGFALLLASDLRAAVFVGCLFIGIGVGNLITLPAIIVQREFAAERYGPLVSRIWAVGQFFYAFAPIATGLLIDAGRSATVLFGCMALQLLAAALCLAGRPSRVRSADEGRPVAEGRPEGPPPAVEPEAATRSRLDA